MSAPIALPRAIRALVAIFPARTAYALAFLLPIACSLWPIASHAQDWGAAATISNTLGVNANRLCIGEASRGDLGCPTYAPSITTAGDISVTGNISAAKFIGDGSGLTNLAAAFVADRIVSNTAAIIANGSSNSISITESGVTTGYYYNGIWVASGVSTTGTVSGTNGYYSGKVGIGTGLAVPNAQLQVSGGVVIGGAGGYLRIAPDTSDSSLQKLAFHATHDNWSQQYYSGLAYSNGGGSMYFEGGPSITNYYDAGSSHIFRTTVWNGTAKVYPENMRITPDGLVGISTSTPRTTLDVKGSVRVGIETSTTLNTCDANRTGAIRYTGNTFQGCDGTGWSSFSNTSGTTTTADRITSGTAQVIANGNSNSISITESGVTTGYYYNGIWVASGVSTTGGISGTTGYYSGFVGIGTTTPQKVLTISSSVDPTVRISNGGNFSPTPRLELYRNAGSLGYIQYVPDGGFTAGLVLSDTRSDASSKIIFMTKDVEKMRLNSDGMLSIGTQSTSTTLHVNGSIRMGQETSTTLNVCDTNRAGAIRYNGSNFQVCYGTGGWANLSDASATITAPDTIISGTSNVTVSQNQSITIATSNTQRIVIGSNGRVGIGVFYPSQTLHVGGNIQLDGGALYTSTAGLIFQTNTGARTYLDSRGINIGLSGQVPTYGVIESAAIYGIRLNVSGTTALMVSGSGNVGIGITPTTAALEVSGTVSATQFTGKFVGDGSGLTNLAAAFVADRIVSNTAAIIANGTTNSISITESGVTTGYYYGGQWVAGSISTTGAGKFNNVSVSTNVSVTGNVSAARFIGDGSLLTNVGVSKLASLSDVSVSSPPIDYGVLTYNPVQAKWQDISLTNVMKISTTTMVPNWPDAIRCYDGTSYFTYTLTNGPWGVSGEYYYSSTNGMYLGFNADGTYKTQGSSSSYDCVTNAWTISQLYSLNRAYNYLGTTLTSAASPNMGLQYSNNGILASAPNLTYNSTTPVVSVTGTVSATNGYFKNISGTTITGKFVGDGSGLTNLAAAFVADRIISGTAQVIANGTTNSISITESGVTTGYYYNGIWVASGVSTTGTISGSNGYLTNKLGIGTTTPAAPLDIYVSNTSEGLRITRANAPLQYLSLNEGLYNSHNIEAYGNKTLFITNYSGAAAAYQDRAIQFRVSGTTNILNLSALGTVGVGELPGNSFQGNPASTTLQVAGSVRLGQETSTTMNTCDANRTGSIRYTGSTFQGCDGTGWSSFSNTSASTVTVDRLTSGTSVATLNPNGVLTLAGRIDLVTGTAITAVGSGAGQNSTANYTSLFGYQAGQNNTGPNLTAVGYLAGVSSSGSFATSVGSYTGQNNASSYLTAVGSYAGQNNSGSGSSAYGMYSARYNTGNFLVAVGYGAASNNTAANVTALGYNAVNSVSNTFSNVTGLGYDAQPTASNQIKLGDNNITAVSTSGIYYGAGLKAAGVVTATYFEGDGSRLTGIATGGSLSETIAINDLTDASASTVNGSIYIGSGSGGTGGTYNIGVGVGVMASNTSGNFNTAMGYNALSKNTSGGNNVANGLYALLSNTSGYFNVANGSYAMYANTSGYGNVATGYNAMTNNTTGHDNLAYGEYALSDNVTGGLNVAVGSYALEYANPVTGTVAIGYSAGKGTSGVTTFINGTFVGYNAGQAITTGINNTFLGYNAGGGVTTGGSNIMIGYNASPPAGIVSSALNIGNAISGSMLTGGSLTFIGGIKANGVVTATYFEGDGSRLTGVVAGAATASDRISTSGVASGANLGAVVADKGTVSFTLAGTAGAAYLHPTLGLVAPGVSTTGTISGTRLFSANRLETRGGLLFNQGSGALDNIINVGANTMTAVDASVGFFAAGVGASDSTYGPYFLARGNAFSALANQRGNIYFSAGNPTSVADTEGSINFLTGNDINRLKIDVHGNVGINLGNLLPHATLDVYGDVSATSLFVSGPVHVNSWTYINGTSAARTPLEVSGTVSATQFTGKFVGDGSGLTGIAGGGATDRITSSTTAAVIANTTGGTVSFTLASTPGAAYLHPTLGLVAPGVSATGTVSASRIFSANRFETRGGIYLNQGTGSTDNLIYLGRPDAGSVDASMGFFAAGVGSGGQNQGPYFLARGNDFSAVSNQRGNMYFTAGNPTGPGPGATEGSINFLTGTSSLNRMNIDWNGNVTIGTASANTALGVYGPISATSINTSGTVYATKFVGDGSSLTGLTAAGSDRISTSGVASGATLGAVVADKGTVSFTLAGTAGAAYLHPTLGLVAPGVSTTGPISGTRAYFGDVVVGVNASTVLPANSIYAKGDLYSDNYVRGWQFGVVSANGGMLWGDYNTYVKGTGSTNIDMAIDNNLALRVLPNNRVAIGGLTAATTSLEVSGTVSATSLFISGDFTHNGNIYGTSDKRLKTDIQPISSSLDMIAHLQPVTFEFRNKLGHTEYGFIAQEVQKLYPSLVQTGTDPSATLSLNYTGLIAPVVRGLQEVNTNVTKLQAENADLRAQLEELRAEVRALAQQRSAKPAGVQK